MENNIVAIIMVLVVLILIILIFLTYFITSRKANKNIGDYKTLTEALLKSKSKLSKINSEIDIVAENLSEAYLKSELKLSKINDKISIASDKLSKMDLETKELQLLKATADTFSSEVIISKNKLKLVELQTREISQEFVAKNSQLKSLLQKLDLYTRIDGFIEYGFFEMPEYLYETSAKFSEEIKRIRQKQKELIKNKNAVEYPESTAISPDKSYNKKILDGQVKLMLSSFNIECDTLISKVSPSSFSRTLERIEKLANSLEKSAATLHCGFNIKYVKLKYEECQLQYQHILKKQEEQEEQRQIREQIREEHKVIKEYERAIFQAEKEEQMYRKMLKKARDELSKVSDEDRIVAEQRITDLEQQLANAEAKEERAKSMAEQTRKGHVYVISNVGSFGENIYKIGLTRRLEPLDRVKELGDASVPFTFDVHAMIYVEDAPALESALHRKFTRVRVNAVNLRKEFFRVDLESIKEAVNDIAGVEAEFKMTALAVDYYESQRLQSLGNQAV